MAGNGAIVRAVAARMSEVDPELGVDLMLTRPVESILMGLDVARRLELIAADVATPQIDFIRTWSESYPELVTVINQICRAAMNGRKQGKLKPAVGSSPASKAAATRKQRQQKGAQQ